MLIVGSAGDWPLSVNFLINLLRTNLFLRLHSAAMNFKENMEESSGSLPSKKKYVFGYWQVVENEGKFKAKRD